VVVDLMDVVNDLMLLVFILSFMTTFILEIFQQIKLL